MIPLISAHFCTSFLFLIRLLGTSLACGPPRRPIMFSLFDRLPIPAPATDCQKFLFLISNSWEGDFDQSLADALQRLSEHLGLLLSYSFSFHTMPVLSAISALNCHAIPIQLRLMPALLPPGSNPRSSFAQIIAVVP